MNDLNSRPAQLKDGSKKRDNRSDRGVFFKSNPAALYLDDGLVFFGRQPAWQKYGATGEIVFNTGMTGYVESLTDPSYLGQILVFTYPLIGNYGVRTADAESSRIQVGGVIVSEMARRWSHQSAEQSLLEWLASQKVPILWGVDTRALTKHLRSEGTRPGRISSMPVRPGAIKLRPAVVSDCEPAVFNQGFSKKIILVDCGAKGNILKSLLKLPLQVKQVPAGYDYTDEAYDGVLLSNGPGDPRDYHKTIAVAARALELGKPVFGICLGSQIMALAAGAGTYKLRFGHRGHNQPCVRLGHNRCYITSQNHGYAVDETSLPGDWNVTFRNLNDGSVEGIEHQSKPFFAVQFHPEACPGPTDTGWLFEKFYAAV